ncbi:hypothetical protein [Streptomyces sp. 8N616]|uniref:hypothetical protein n=1 Tax=Streptomyces sp. 8N616 TaxID=3457414 RepID=UPI003FCFDA5D
MTTIEPSLDFDSYFHFNFEDLSVTAALMLAADLPAELARAEWLVKEVCSQAYSQWDAIGDPDTWIKARIARTVIAAYGRRRSWWPRAGQPTGPARPPRASGDPLIDVLDEIPARQRAVAVLWLRENWPQGKIERELGMKPRVVSSQIARAEATLKRRLKQLDEPDDFKGDQS